MSSAEGNYDFAAIEAKWQQHWIENKTFRTAQPGAPGFDPNKPKFYVLDMFPYPSGVGLHVGHPLGYIATDIYARYQRMRGYNVLHPMGYDAFGLPAEQYAVEHGVPPRETTQRNIDNMRAQLQRLGMGYDWDREIATTDVSYYRWTQWIFLQMYNSWYDEQEERARPIAELVHNLEQENLVLGPNGELVPVGAAGLQEFVGLPPGTQTWSELSHEERRAVLDSYRLAYLDEVPVNWCPALGTVLANEEVTNEGRSDRGNHPVYRRPLRQWMLRITAYAERLEKDLELVDWPEAIKLMQRNWIGRSEGAEVDFAVADTEEVIRVYTTRPDTLFGATYMVLAPEHELVGVVTSEAQRSEVNAYVEAARHKSDLDRTADTKEKTGVFTGAFAINPVNNERIPIWIADYVLMGYGTGAIMAVPAHDTRDFEFATKFSLPIIQVVQPSDEGIDWHGYTGDGTAINSGKFDGLSTAEFKKRIVEWLEAEELGQGAVNYKLRDWLFSRQRYWGEPFPIVHDIETGDVYALDERELPVVLPSIDDYRPKASDDPEAPPEPPLGRASKWGHVRGYVNEAGYVQTLGPDETPPDDIMVRTYRRELNTMPQWAGSCWYYLRYLDNRNEERFAAEEVESYWMAPREDGQGAPGGGVDLYVGGAEHAVLHLLYSRFWHKVLYDLDHVSSPEPFGKLFNQGYIQAYAYRDERGIAVPAAEVVDEEGRPAADVQGETGHTFFYNGEKVTQEYGKMGKSLKNAVSPDEICAQFGTDTLRAYEMYLGPLEASKPWNTRDIIGMSRFLQSVWKRFVAEDGSLKVTDSPPDDQLLRKMHKTIKKVTADMDGLRFNTAIAALIELNNAMKGDAVSRDIALAFIKMLSPIAPHLCEELWERLVDGERKMPVIEAKWPAYDEALCVDEQVEIALQVLGKVRSKAMVSPNASEDELKEVALADPKVQQSIAGKTVRKVICIPGRLVNVVAN